MREYPLPIPIVDIPMTADRLRRQAQQAMDAGQWDAAQAALESLAQHQPHDVSIHMALADVILRRGRMRAATRHLLQAIPLLPNDASLIAQLAWRLSTNGEIQGARACLAHLARAPNPPAEVLSEQAHLRWALGEIPVARALMDRAVALGVDTSSEYYLDAMLYQFLGRLAEAEAVLLACLRRWPRYGDAAVILANLRRQTPEANHLELFRESLGRISAASTDARDKFARAEFESAIFKVHDDCGRHDEAWSALARSNALMHDINPYDAQAEAALTDALVGIPEPLAAAVTDAAAEFAGPMPIFIVGMPRSGSTLLDQMLSSHSQVISAGEIPDFQHQLHWMADVAPRSAQGMQKAIERSAGMDFAELGARYLQQTQWRAHGHRFYIDKLPINVRMVPFIRRALPRAPILHLAREPMDVCYSNLKVMFGKASPYCYDQQALAHYYGQYVRLTNHWRASMSGAMLEVSYAALVNEPEATMRRVLHHCGLAMEEACLHPERNPAPVATPSSVQVREPVHSRNLGQWRRYAKQLEPLRLALAEQGVGVG
ncbi:sulfotransferase family protein [Rhodanobacter sp. OR87]|uniref:tetratricopeptide repeat-containing sulfotransferase family protein n=1 Tax=Rhodanobacter sp. OR87 TaxID=1076523 RepID=UPI0004163AF1|nr:sulfotransferase family protein [Rhodanobacter sp. OR87]